jgi:rhodanese-related sulfurtransferase
VSSGHRISVDELLAESRAQLRRVTPEEAARQLDAGAAVVDIRSESQRDRDGVIPGSHFVPRNVLEWRLDPGCAHAIPELGGDKRVVILVCNEGFQSSLAAATLRRMARRRSADRSPNCLGLAARVPFDRAAGDADGAAVAEAGDECALRRRQVAVVR